MQNTEQFAQTIRARKPARGEADHLWPAAHDARHPPSASPELEILHGIDPTKIYPRRVRCHRGRSGSSKSTLMNIIGVLDKPTRR